MVFASPIFLFFFLPLALAAGLLAGRRARNPILLAASLLFYAWGAAPTLPLLIGLIAVNWAAGLAVAREGRRWRQAIFVACIALDIGCLVFFKYTTFLISNFITPLTGLPPPPAAVLPLGISFFTFHLLSYLIDIDRGAAAPQRRLTDFALYIAFFPQLIAGPIIRYHDVAAQLTGRRVTRARFAAGVERFVLGLGKKVLLADPLGTVADRVFALSNDELSASVAWLGVVAYALQLYYDFSGYSDMAIGLGRMFGFEFLENFNYPFVSRSISEFWRRWHISLSNWFRDYLYLPLALHAARAHARRRAPGPINDRPQLALVFLLCGLWHGAAWTFVVWGGIHGVCLALERGRFGTWLGHAPMPLRHAYVLLVILVAWVFFRAESLRAATGLLAAMAGARGRSAGLAPFSGFLADRHLWLLLPALIGLVPTFGWLARDWRARAAQSFGRLGADTAAAEAGGGWLGLARLPVLGAVLAGSLIYVSGSTYSPFLYFRF